MEAAEADAEDCDVVEATAASYSLWTLFKTFMAFTCRLSTYSGSVIGGGICCTTIAASASSVLVIGGNPRGPSPDGPRPEE